MTSTKNTRIITITATLTSNKTNNKPFVSLVRRSASPFSVLCIGKTRKRWKENVHTEDRSTHATQMRRKTTYHIQFNGQFHSLFYRNLSFIHVCVLWLYVLCYNCNFLLLLLLCFWFEFSFYASTFSINKMLLCKSIITALFRFGLSCLCFVFFLFVHYQWVLSLKSSSWIWKNCHFRCQWNEERYKWADKRWPKKKGDMI